MDYNLDNMEWRCQDCNATAPPTSSDYMVILRHQKGHHIRLIDKASGEVLATSLKQALARGIDIPGAEKPSDEPPGGPSEKPPQKPGELPDRGMEISEEGITFLITLPPVVFTLFDAAKAAKLVEDEDMDIDHWIFECIQKRFTLDYNLRLMLVPIGETE